LIANQAVAEITAFFDLQLHVEHFAAFRGDPDIEYDKLFHDRSTNVFSGSPAFQREQRSGRGVFPVAA
jgi:hypothetical protein